MNLDVKLSPPWYALQKELSVTLGADPEVQVSPLQETPGGTYQIRVTTANQTKAQALAVLLNPTYNYGNVSVAVGVFDQTGKQVLPEIQAQAIENLATIVSAAFKGNPYYLGVELRPLFPGAAPSTYPIFQAKVIQYYNDNLSDLFFNKNIVAADAFQEIVRTFPRVGPFCSTAKIG